MTLPSGTIIEDKKLAAGGASTRAAKAGDRVGMRYVGKLLKNGKEFDSNTKGKPFSFKLGRGEVIKVSSKEKEEAKEKNTIGLFFLSCYFCFSSIFFSSPLFFSFSNRLVGLGRRSQGNESW